MKSIEIQVSPSLLTGGPREQTDHKLAEELGTIGKRRDAKQ